MRELEFAKQAASFLDNFITRLSWLSYMYFVSIKPHAPSDGGNEFKNIISNVLHVDEVPKPIHKIMETDSTHVKRDTRDSP